MSSSTAEGSAGGGGGGEGASARGAVGLGASLDADREGALAVVLGRPAAAEAASGDELRREEMAA